MIERRSQILVTERDIHKDIERMEKMRVRLPMKLMFFKKIVTGERRSSLIHRYSGTRVGKIGLAFR